MNSRLSTSSIILLLFTFLMLALFAPALSDNFIITKQNRAYIDDEIPIEFVYSPYTNPIRQDHHSRFKNQKL